MKNLLVALSILGKSSFVSTDKLLNPGGLKFMKRLTWHCLMAIPLLAMQTTSGNAQILFTSSASAPSPGANDITNTGTAVSLSDTSYNDLAYTNNTRAVPNSGTGQSFTIGATPMTLNSFSIMGGGASGVSSSTLWNVAVYSVGTSNVLSSALTSVQGLTLASLGNFTSNSTDWMTFSFTGANAVTLAANTQYVVQISTDTNSYYFGFAPTTDSGFSGGNAVNFDGTAPNAMTAIVNPDVAYNYIFDVGLSPAVVPEPATDALLLIGGMTLMWTYRRRAQTI